MKKITIENNITDALICLNSELLPIQLIQELSNKIPIIAADGAGTILLENNITPDFIVGDLDSFNSNNIFSKSFPNNKLIYLPEQETNDFEKTLQFCYKNSLSNILIMGIHGGEYEHSLNNWSVLSKYSKLMNLNILDKNRYGFCISENFTLQTERNEIISLIPLGQTKISTKGLKWELKEEVIGLGIREGARNQSLENEIKIEIHSGELFVFCNSKFPNLLKYS
ncbi:MAG: thiamine diphosphokinase [Candidatus Kapaibacteriota bacterium]